MNDETARQLTRQLKVLNFWITVFGTLALVSLAVIIFLLFKVVTFVQDTSERLNSIEDRTRQTLDVRSQICDSNTLAGLLQDRSTFCNGE